MDEPMENLGFDEEEELDEFMDDDEDVLDEDEEWLMAPVTPPRATVTVLSTYEMIDDLCVRMSNLEYRHEELMKKMAKVSDAEVADSITIGEIHPRVATVEEQVESKVDTNPSGQMAVPGQDVIVGLSQQVQTLQTTLHGAELQNQQLRTRVTEIESRDDQKVTKVDEGRAWLAPRTQIVWRGAKDLSTSKFQWRHPSPLWRNNRSSQRIELKEMKVGAWRYWRRRNA
nr:hypothetical protein [Tanacetum cinerariifolium]